MTVEYSSMFFSDAAATTPTGSAKLLTRPWMEFWPPNSENEMKAWLQTDTPEVLRWRFNPADTFDRPWRAYTRSRLASQEQAYQLMPTNDPVPLSADEKGNDYISDHNEDIKLIEDHARGLPEVLCEELEEQLKKLSLPEVHPEEFNYLAPLQLYQDQKPYLSRLPYTENLKRSNIVGKSYPVTVYNIRGHESLLTLDKSGFEFHNLPLSVPEWTDDVVRTQYIPLLDNWLKGMFKCERLFIYAYNFRGNDPEGDKGWKKPFYLVHCDATEASCLLRMKLHFPGEEDVLKKRYRFVNIWRSITPPDQDCPLALCDYRTITKREYIKTDVVFPHCCDEGYDVQHSPAHRWFYRKGMSTDDVILFKLDDSADDVAKCVAHAAFKDPTANTVTRERASIEVRAIILGGE